MLSTAIAAPKERSANGSASAIARTAGAACSGRWAAMTADGSTAPTGRSRGSYDPVPAPTFSTLSAPPIAAASAAAILGSSRRPPVYPGPIRSYTCEYDTS
jgi:hypothetical protein